MGKRVGLTELEFSKAEIDAFVTFASAPVATFNR